MLDSHVHGLNLGGALHRRGGQVVSVELYQCLMVGWQDPVGLDWRVFEKEDLFKPAWAGT